MGAAFTIMGAFYFWIGISKSTRNNIALHLQNCVAEIDPLKIYFRSPLRQHKPPDVV